MRFEDTPNLFGRGLGRSTCGDFKCGICGTLYNEGNDAAEDYDGDSTGLTEFAGILVCEYCFEAIEGEILHRMPEILSWYSKLLASKRKHLENQEAELKNIIGSAATPSNV